MEMNDKALLTFNDTVFEQFELAEDLRLKQSDSDEQFYQDRYTSTIIDTTGFIQTLGFELRPDSE